MHLILVANAHVSSWLDNKRVSIIISTSRCINITPDLKKLHWLPVEYHSEFKTATLVYKFLHTCYFALYISSHSGS